MSALLLLLLLSFADSSIIIGSSDAGTLLVVVDFVFSSCIAGSIDVDNIFFVFFVMTLAMLNVELSGDENELDNGDGGNDDGDDDGNADIIDIDDGL